MESTRQGFLTCCEECGIILQQGCTYTLEGCQKVCKDLLNICKCCAESCPCSLKCLSSCCPRFGDTTPVTQVSALDSIDDVLDKGKATLKLKEDSKIRNVLSSFFAFFCGLLLTSVYGFTVLFILNYNLYFCIVTTTIMGFFLSLGMAFYETVRVNMLLMLLQFFSAHGKELLLWLGFIMIFTGPGLNTLDNVGRVGDTMQCGMEKFVNQTIDMMLLMQKPLMLFANSIKKLAESFKGVGDKANDALDNLSYEVKRIGHGLHRVWFNLYNLKEICNEAIGAPDKKCFEIFKNGKQNCLNVMGKGGFICNVVDAASVLCHLSNPVCVAPAFVQFLARSHKTKPIQWMIQNFKEQFAFNMTVNKDFDITFNSSKSMFQAARDILEEIDNQIAPYREAASMFTYFIFFLILNFYVKALWYRTSYLFENAFDNVYITRNFVELDAFRARRGAEILMPLNKKESAKLYRPASLSLSKKETQGYMYGIITVFRNSMLAFTFMCVDYGIYWILQMVYAILGRDPIVKATTPIGRESETSFFSESIHSLANSLNTMQADSTKTVASNCLVVPAPPNHQQYIILGIVHAVALFVCIFGPYIQRLRHSICAYYYPFREQQRICYLYNKLMTKRHILTTNLKKSLKATGDTGHTNIFNVLALKVPLLRKSRLTKGTQCCTSCAKIFQDFNSFEFRPCITTGCKALYCRDCADILNNTCIMCLMPFTYDNNIDVEMDSSDEEDILVWMQTRKNMEKTHTEKRKQLKKRIQYTKSDIKTRAKRGGIKSQDLLKTIKEMEKDYMTSESTDNESSMSSDDSDEMDFEYQDRSESSGSSDEESS
ncbi:DC-STAMP domain-containing protein 2-like [Xenopus laevis]|uniref:DC-STAMP domain-containing protein 2-like n=1 Tax=Xenopus laevis TaxID=8355 RepID=A0A8J1MK35_XENLA|nr:DC-STAMP domain-containing protein 2-like [Xenopus laevis]